MSDTESNLQDLREQIAEVDQSLLEQLARRRQLVADVVEHKLDAARAVRDPLREEQLLVRLAQQAQSLGLNTQLVTRVFQAIIEDSVLMQQAWLQNHTNGGELERPRVAYLGGPGSYSHMATHAYFERRGGEVVDVGRNSFEAIIDAVEQGHADYGVLPVENTTSGSITQVRDLLQHMNLHIVGEETQPIQHCLLGLPGTSPDEVREVLAHPQVRHQCTQWLGRTGHGNDVTLCSSTADAMRRVVESGDRARAAIGSEEGGALHGLVVLQRELANHTGNETRFLVVGREPVRVSEQIPARTTFLMSTSQKPGALVEALLVLRERGINMSRIESRPIPGNPWEEMFHVDVEANAESETMRQALDDLGRMTRFLKVLGCYPIERISPTAIPAPALAATAKASEVQAPAVIKSSSRDKWRLASREYKAEDTIVRVGDAAIGGDGFSVIAGPCSVESAQQIEACAELVRGRGGVMLRGGCFKPRTSPYSFQGLGLDGLAMMAEAGRRNGLPIVTEVMDTAQVGRVAEVADVLQIGARNMQNFELLKAVGKTTRPVLLKRGMMASLEELLSAAEYVLAGGNMQVILCERGIRTFETASRNTLDISAVPLLKSMTHLPVIIDPSHAVGIREMVTPLARAAKAVGAHGVIVETHPNPSEALSDAHQQLAPEEFSDMMASLHALSR